ncbi:hypothetical protein V5799_013403 [Amblyomma americanum]|uniref:Uncharacterized protein n=1 Tax=Amblyomma americanum TaxID=6943 RepID=A0AAQ4E5Z4_AMBAM
MCAYYLLRSALRPDRLKRVITSPCFLRRLHGSGAGSPEHKNRTVLMYVTSMTVLVGGLSYAAVPLYRMYCQVAPGETVLAFYTARNPSDKPVDGIATYNILPFEAGKYFNKIQVGDL